MDFIKSIGDAMLGAKDFVLEKNRKSALANRLRAVVKCEEQSAQRAYMALGRYYYHNLRDAGNSITEQECTVIDAAEKRIEQATSHLNQIYSDMGRVGDAEEIDLDDVQEIDPPKQEMQSAEEDAAVEGVLDEAVEAVETSGEAEGDIKEEELKFES